VSDADAGAACDIVFIVLDALLANAQAWLLNLRGSL